MSGKETAQGYNAREMLADLWEDKVYFVPVRNGRRVCLPRGDHIAKCIEQESDYYENDLLDAIAGLSVSGVYYDIGAHCGNHTLFFSEECLSSHVLSFEPRRESFDCLVETVRANSLSNVCPVYGAVSTGMGWAENYLPDPTASNTGSNRVRESASGDTFCYSIYRFLRMLSPDVVKIDIEADASLIILAILMEDKYPSVIAVECDSEGRFQKVNDVLAERGYNVSRRYCRTPTYMWVLE